MPKREPIWRRYLRMFGPDVRSDVDEELRFHIERKMQALIEQGARPEDARAEAIRQFGGVDEVRHLCESIGKEQVRRMKWSDYWSGWRQDIQYTLRGWRRAPGFAAMAILMFGLGMSGASAIFSIYNGLYLRPLPFHEPEQLLDLDEIAPRWNLEFVGIAYPDFDVWRRENKTFDGMAVYTQRDFNLATEADSERVPGLRATYDLVKVLGITPVLGRSFTAAEDVPKGTKVAVLAHAMWQRTFGGRSDVLGKVLRIDSEHYEIIGVLPESAQLPGNPQFWIPLQESAINGSGWYLGGVGRLKHGVTIEQAKQNLLQIHKAEIPRRDVNEITSPRMMPLRDRMVGDFRTAAAVLLGSVGVVLLIACGNIAALLLARAGARQREIGIRAALGAGRARVIRQLVTESLLLAGVGSMAGLALGWLGLKGILALMPPGRFAWLRFDPDYRFAAFAILLTAGSALIFGLWPAWQASRVDLRTALHETSRSTGSRERRRGLRILVVAEVALAMVLLVGAGLLIAAFQRLQNVNPGFRAEGVLTYTVALPGVKYGKPEQRYSFFTSLIEKSRALPGVTAVSAASTTPLGGHNGNFFEVEGAPPLKKGEQDPVVLSVVAAAGYTKAMGVTLAEGRDFTESDLAAGAPPVITVNESFARRAWPGQSAIGKRVRHRGSKDPWWQVVGVTRDVKHYGLEREMRPSVCRAMSPTLVRSAMTIVLRTSGPPEQLAAPSRTLVRQADSDLPLFEVRTMETRLRESMWVRRAYSTLIWTFASVALLLSIGGVYGVVSFIVNQRAGELGIRLALGAAPGQVISSVLRDGFGTVGIGLILGLAAGYGAAQLMERMLFGVQPFDAPTYTVAVSLLLALTLFANWIPARRAARIDPVRVLRSE